MKIAKRTEAFGLALISALAVTACVADSFELGESEQQPLKFANGMWDGALAVNPILANEHARKLLVEYPLNAITLATVQTPIGAMAPPNPSDPYLLWQLEHDNADEVMKYLVRCALAPGQTITVTLRYGTDAQGLPIVRHYEGEYGLVERWYNDGLNRLTGPAPLYEPFQPLTEIEQIRVSQCLGALNNVNRGVPISIRSNTLPVQQQVSIGRYDYNGNKVASLEECDSQSPVWGNRDSCWDAQYVGQCTPETRIVVGTGGPPVYDCTAPALGSADLAASAPSWSNIDPMLRIVPGIRGTNHSDFVFFSDDSCGT
ncbi:MAG: hypothetical protein AAGC55_23410, partial [Myxococcota bacterium]